MLWDIIKLYWQNRKEYKVIIIAPNHKDILVLDAVKKSYKYSNKIIFR